MLPALGRGLSNSVGALIMAQDRHCIICVMNRFSDNFMIMMLTFGCGAAHIRKKSGGISTKSVNGP